MRLNLFSGYLLSGILASHVVFASVSVTPAQLLESIEQLNKRACVLESTAVSRGVLLDKNFLRLSGHLNKASLYVEDGMAHDFNFVDNATHPSQLRLEAGFPLGAVLAGADIETDVTSSASSTLDLETQRDTFFTVSIRKAEVYFKNDDWGKLSLGRGYTASYLTLVSDLSGTGFVLNADIPLLIGNIPVLDDYHDVYGPKVRQIFGDFDGLRRSDRIRYDTPSWKGFTFGASFVGDNVYDAALRFSQELNGVKLQAAASYAKKKATTSTTQKGVASGSVLFPNGFNLTLAAGHSDISNQTTSLLLYGKVGLNFNLCLQFKEGVCVSGFLPDKTSIAMDVERVNDFNAEGDVGTAFGLALAQEILPLSSEVYTGWRLHDFEPGTDTGNDYRWLWGWILGARIKF